MKKQFILLVLIILGSVCFTSLENNGVNACGNECNATWFTSKKCASDKTIIGYDEKDYAHIEILPYPILNLIN